jgi:hypothetical protein
MQTSNTPSGGPLGQFITQHSEKVTGVLEGFDRVRVQASLRSLYHASVMEYYLLSPTRQGGFDHRDQRGRAVPDLACARQPANPTSGTAIELGQVHPPIFLLAA